MRDALGDEKTVCLKNYCGPYGKGTQCIGTPGIPNCVKSQVYPDIDGEEDCETCAPGYFQTNRFHMGAARITALRGCSEMEGHKRINYFVRNSTEEMKQAQMDDMQRQLDEDGGRTLEDALYYLAQAFAPFGDLTRLYDWMDDASTLSGQIVEYPPLDWQRYETITVNIYLARGIHHFIQCDELTTTPDSDLDGLPLLCRDTDKRSTYYPVRRNELMHDNLEFYVQPLDCEHWSEFSASHDSSLFSDWCVDWEVGHQKPQIRLHNTVSYFNITNFAQFENVQFTAEDSLAMIEDKADSPDFAHSPMVKCVFEEEPTGHLANATVQPWTQALSGLDFSCSTGYNHSVDLPPSEEEVGCEEGDFAYESVRACSGEPYHDQFFRKHVLDLGTFTATDASVG